MTWKWDGLAVAPGTIAEFTKIRDLPPSTEPTFDTYSWLLMIVVDEIVS